MRRGMRRGKMCPFPLILWPYNRVQSTHGITRLNASKTDASRHASRYAPTHYDTSFGSVVLTTISLVPAEGEP